MESRRACGGVYRPRVRSAAAERRVLSLSDFVHAAHSAGPDDCRDQRRGGQSRRCQRSIHAAVRHHDCLRRLHLPDSHRRDGARILTQRREAIPALMTPLSRRALTKESRMRRLFPWCLAIAFLAAAFATPSAQSPSSSRTPKPNYELAADWTSQKIGRLVFDTTVTPRWLETGDRFWYAYQTR